MVHWPGEFASLGANPFFPQEEEKREARLGKRSAREAASFGG